MKWLRPRQDYIYLILALLLAATSVVASQRLKDSDIGWVFGMFSVTVVVTQFMYVYEMRNNAGFFSDYLKIKDKFLKDVVVSKFDEIQQLARKASEDRVDLKLDDLFLFVTELVKICRRLDCVDIRIERWETDIRAIKYFDANRDAIRRGAKISRIFVFDKTLRSDLAKFLAEGAESEEIRNVRELLKDQAKIGVEIDFIFSDEVDGGNIRDFGVFDKRRVLDENFDAFGNSKYEGFISSVPSVVNEYSELHTKLKDIAEENKASLRKLIGA
jgi:hypothetical protein